MGGAGTNIPELLTIAKTIGKRAMLLYFGLTVGISFAAGYITNLLLMPDFKPVLDYNRTSKTIAQANFLMYQIPEWINWICSAILIGYAFYALYQNIRQQIKKA